MAIAAGSASLANFYERKNPDLAMNLWPFNGFAAEASSATQVKQYIADNDFQFPETIDPKTLALAKRSFAAEPMATESVAVIGLARDEAARAELMRKAFEISKREQFTLGWLIINSQKEADLDGLLQFYDINIRINSNSANALLPNMINALQTEAAVPALAGLLDDAPPWSRLFWNRIPADNAQIIANAARLREKLYNEAEDPERYNDPELIRKLVLNGQFDTAQSLYKMLAPDSGAIVNNADFSREGQFPPFDWWLASTGEYGAEIAQSRLILSAVRNSGGLFARQLVKLPDDIITLDIIMDAAPEGDNRVSADLLCAENIDRKPPVINIALRREKTSQKISNVNSGCSYYNLDIRGRSSETGDGFDIIINSITLN